MRRPVTVGRAGRFAESQGVARPVDDGAHLQPAVGMEWAAISRLDVLVVDVVRMVPSGIELQHPIAHAEHVVDTSVARMRRRCRPVGL